MASKIGIANRALTKLGEARIISLNDDVKAARTLASMYDIVLEAELRAHLWSFALARTTLAALSSAPAFGYGYAYQLPADCLRVVMVGEWFSDLNRSDAVTGPTRDWVIEGRSILTDRGAPLALRYVRRAADPGDYDAAFVEALACRLAAECAEDITQSSTKREQAWAEYKRAMLDALRANAIELPPEQPADDAWILARF